MDIKQLKIFCEVYRQRGYSLAAKKLKLTQSAVSQQIRSLEKNLNVNLFDEKDRLQPTAAGDLLFKEGMKILSQMDDLENAVRHASGFGSGIIHFGMIDVAAVKLLPNILGAFKKKFPQIKLDATVKRSGELIELVENRALDFAVVVTNRIPETLSTSDLYTDSLVAIVPKDSRLNKKLISVKDLRGEPLILYPTSSHSRMVVEDAFRSARIVPSVIMEMHYPDAIVSLVHQGMGIGIVSELSVRDMKMLGHAIVRVKELEGARNIGIVMCRFRRTSPQALQLISMINKK